jgi:site-specific DNA-cytosine methylase
MKLCLDLCSGIGGFSQAFRENKEWKVITVDINPKFKPDMILDLVDVVENKSTYDTFWNLKPDVILASPPCERWSIANTSWPKEGIYQASKVLGAVLEIVAIMKPDGWIIENPKGRMRWFLHKPAMTVSLAQFGYRTVKPTDFWTNIDIGLLRSVNMRKNPNGYKFSRDVSRRPEKRAQMPYGLSRLILDTVMDVIP